jgi:uridine kinase
VPAGGALHIETLARWLIERAGDGPEPRLVALDGRSGVGKSTLAAAVAERTGAAVIDGDDFYAGGTAAFWDAMTAEQKTDRVIDWRRQRTVLELLWQGRAASWFPYDWDADDGSRSTHLLTCEPTGVVILEGAYSARPELADLLSLRVLLDLPRRERRRRLVEREGARYRAEWETRWSEAEDHYFGKVMLPGAFDLVLSS